MNRPAVYLPIDTPKVLRVNTPITNNGLSWAANNGNVPSPVRRPFTQWISTVFPWVKGSDVSPDAIMPKFGYSLNDYSPSFHRPADTTLIPAIPRVYRGKAKGAQRVSGKSTPWPFAQPSYTPLIPGVKQ